MRRSSASTRAVAFVVAWAAAATPAAFATDYQINTLLDSGGGNCTLREALQAASTNLAVDGCAAGSAVDDIELVATGTYPFTGGQVSISGGQDITVRGASGDPNDYVVSLGKANRFLSIDGSVVELDGVTFLQGTADGEFGGVVSSIFSDLTLRNANFVLNEADLGGAIYYSATSGAHSLTIEDSIFLGNDARADTTDGGAVWARVRGTSSVRIVDSRFTTNEAVAAVGGATEGGGLYVLGEVSSAITLERTRFDSNAATSPGLARGGGASLDVTGGVVLTVRDCEFIENSLSGVIGSGGAGLSVVSTDDSRSTLDRNLVVASTAGSSNRSQLRLEVADTARLTLSNALLADSLMNGVLAAISDNGAELTLNHVTATGNSQAGVAVFIDAGSPSARVYNTIAFGNSGPDFSLAGGVTTSNNLVGVDPDFVDAAKGDYRLSLGSAAIDQGDLNLPGGQLLDLDGEQRVTGDDTDIGAYEYGIFTDGFESGDVSQWSSAVSP